MLTTRCCKKLSWGRRQIYCLLLIVSGAVGFWYGKQITIQTVSGSSPAPVYDAARSSPLETTPISRDATALESLQTSSPRSITKQYSSKASVFISTKSNNSKGADAADSHVPLVEVELFPHWTTSDPHDLVNRVFLYSAFLSLHGLPRHGSHVDLVVIQGWRLDLILTCCAKLADQSLHQGGAAVLRYHFPPTCSATEFQMATIYRCHFPFTAQQLGAGHVTVTATSCPVTGRNGYAAVLTPERVPGGLGLCGKAAFGQSLNPEKLLEWFEVQRLLGVDKIVIYDLNNTDVVRRIFRRHQKSGLLDLMPLTLPGGDKKRHRRFGGWGRQAPHTRSDDTFPHLDCFQRLAGYDYVMAIDTDEVIMPRKMTTLKPVFHENFKKNSLVASLTLRVKFFLEDWGPVDPTAPLLFLRFLNSSRPNDDSHKYVYVPSRVLQIQTHKVTPASGFNRTALLPPKEATIFHYRNRPGDDSWWKKIAEMKERFIIDRTMLKFKDELVPRVEAARRDVGL